MVDKKVDKLEVVQKYQDKTVEMQEKVKDIETKSDQEKIELSQELDLLLMDLKKDADVLKAQNDTTEQSKLLGFQTEIENVKTKVDTSPDASSQSSSNSEGNEDKNFFQRAGESISETTNKIIDRGKQNWDDWTWGKAKVIGSGAGILLAGVGIYKGIKSLFKKDEKKEEDSKKFWESWWWNFLKRTEIGTAAYYVSHGVYTGKWGLKEFFDWNKKQKISFEDALPLVQGNLNGISEKELLHNIGQISYDEVSSEIRSYGKDATGNFIGTKIDKENMKIEGIDKKFSDYSQLIFMANFINHLKSNYIGKGANATPFEEWNRWTGDIYFHQWAHASGNGKEKRIEVMSGGLFSTLRQHVPDIDGGLFSSRFKDWFCSYLNQLACWEKQSAWYDHNQQHPENPVNQISLELQKAIQKTKEEDNLQWTRWEIKAIQHPEHPDKYTIQSWNSHEVEIITKPELKIVGCDLLFSSFEELVRTANFVNKMKCEYGGKWSTSAPFSIESEFLFRSGMFVDRSDQTLKEHVLTKKTLKEKFPTIDKKENRKTFLDYLNTLPAEGNFTGWK